MAGALLSAGHQTGLDAAVALCGGVVGWWVYDPETLFLAVILIAIDATL